MKPRVFVARRVAQAALDRIAAACDMDLWEMEDPATREELLRRVVGVHGIFCTLTERIDGELIDAAGANLRVVSQMAVGYDNIDMAAAQARGVKVGNTPGTMVDATADIAFALLLAAARRIVEADAYVRGQVGRVASVTTARPRFGRCDDWDCGLWTHRQGDGTSGAWL